MAKQANKMMIGGFVVIAVSILAASVVIFGSGDFFKKRNFFVMFFDGSIKGLEVGAPVLFRGVQVGQVSSIVIKADMEANTTYIPVIIEVDPSKWQIKEGAGAEFGEIGSGERVKLLIEKGLRAELTTQSLITGKLAIEVSMKPGSPLRLTNLDPEHVELPTVPSTIAKLGKALEKLDLKKIQKRLMSALGGADKLLNNPDLDASVKALRTALEDAQHLVEHVNDKVDPLTDNLNTTLTDARQQINTVGGKADTTLTSFNKLARDVDRKVDPLVDDTRDTLAEARKTLAQGNRTLKTVNEDLSEDSPLMVELENTLREFAGMARSVRLLADFLKRHPESLLQGKGQEKASGGK
jgi:paraquat-inducible protein B